MLDESTDQGYIDAFGKNVRRIRRDRKMSMQKLANLANIELSQVYRIETGKINPKLTTIILITKALNIGINDLFEGI